MSGMNDANVIQNSSSCNKSLALLFCAEHKQRNGRHIVAILCSKLWG